MIATQALIIFGSALSSSTPGDVDVACERELNDVDRARVAAWASERGVKCSVVDAHPIITRWDPPYGRIFRLPQPCGWYADFAVLSGSPDVKVERTNYYSIPAILRAVGHCRRSAGLTWRALRAYQNSLFGPMIDIGPADTGEHGGDWSNYITGLVALRSAMAKAERWRDIFADAPEGPLLWELAKRGASPAGIEWARRSSSGAGARLLFREDGVHTQYGQERIPYNEAIEFFCGGTAT